MEETENRVLLGRGNLTGTGGAAAAPGSGATVVIYDSMAAVWRGLYEEGLPFHRIQFAMKSSADSGASGVAITASLDRGANYDADASYTYLTASGLTTYDVLTKGGHVKIAYTNSAAVLTTWRYEVFGIYDRNPGA